MPGDGQKSLVPASECCKCAIKLRRAGLLVAQERRTRRLWAGVALIQPLRVEQLISVAQLRVVPSGLLPAPLGEVTKGAKLTRNKDI